jgi:hypothetical protein
VRHLAGRGQSRGADRPHRAPRIQQGGLEPCSTNPILPNPSGLERVTVQGQALASADKSVEFSTVLGSCVATCLFDPDARVGGMNHFLLAEPPPAMTRRWMNTTACS